MPQHVEVETRGHIGVVTLQHPTMPPSFFFELRDAVQELSAREDLRAVVIRSEAKAFSYGLDLPAAMAENGELFRGGLARERGKLRQLVVELQTCFTALAECPVPTIAAIHGWCIGGGLDLATACDLRLASEDARISLRETRIAIVADLGSLQRLPRIVGHGHARELAYTGMDVSVQRAAEIGLVNSIHPDREALHTAAEELAGRIAANPPLTVRGVKQVMNYCEDKSVRDGLEYVATWNASQLASEDLGEAVQAFVAKREPSFKGR